VVERKMMPDMGTGRRPIYFNGSVTTVCGDNRYLSHGDNPRTVAMGRIPDAMGPCGIYCGACPSFAKTCKGCGSDDRDQGRRSKWGCRLRVCCLEQRGLDLCNQCDEFPCRKHASKLSASHPGDPRFGYRRETVANLERVSEIGYDGWLAEQEVRWRCPGCGGRVTFYHYTCTRCGAEVYPT
jgi:hypothetical protein